MLNDVWRALGYVSIEEVRDLQAEFEAKVVEYKDELADRQSLVEALDKRVVTREAQIERKDEDIASLRRQLEQKYEDITLVEAELVGTRRQLADTQQDLIDAQTRLMAILSVPLWTRRGKAYHRVTPGESMVSEHDPLIAKLGREIAHAFAERLPEVARESQTARIMLTRAVPVTSIEHQSHRALDVEVQSAPSIDTDAPWQDR